MNSLQELNTWGATEVDVLDARPSQVIFNRVAPLAAVDQTFDAYDSLTVTPTPGIEIVEIVNYQTANVRYRVTVKTGSSPLFTGSTVTFGTLPSGVNLTQVGDVYTISGIRKVSDWDAVKNFTWTLPVAFASYPQWYLECTIIYYSSALATDVETTWEIIDDRFYTVAELTSTTTISVTVGVSSPASAALTSTTTIYANPWNQVAGAAAISSSATFSCEGNVNVTFLNSVSTMTVNAVKTARAVAPLASVSTMTTIGFVPAINLDPRTYLANDTNSIFSTNTPQVASNYTDEGLNIKLSSSLGKFGFNNNEPSNTIELSGKASDINFYLPFIQFYPTVGSSASGTFTWTHSYKSTNQNVNFNSIVYGNSTYVAVGDGGVILTSADAITWTTRTSGTTDKLTKIIWTGTYFVIISNTTTLLRSSDAVTWTTVTSAQAGLSIAYKSTAGVKYVIVNYNGLIYSSSNADATTWTYRAGGADPNLNDVIHNGTNFIAVGQFFGVGNTIAKISSDGITWTNGIGNSGDALYQLDYLGSKVVAGGGDGQLWYSSNNGSNWTKSTQYEFLTGSLCIDIINDGSSFYAFFRKSGSGTYIFKSTGGEVWVLYNLIPDITINQVSYSGSLWVLVGNQGTIKTSTNLIDFTSRNLTSLFSSNVTLTGIANVFAETILTFNATTFTIWRPTRSQVIYGGKFDLLLVAGGGGGHPTGGGNPGTYGGGGGGGGGVGEFINQTLTYSAYYYTVGFGGQYGSIDGGNTSIVAIFGPGGSTLTAYGGKSGANSNGGMSGGTIGAGGGISYLGQTGGPYGGGGGGSGAAATGSYGAPGRTLTTVGTPWYGNVYGGGGGGGTTTTISFSGSDGGGTGGRRVSNNGTNGASGMNGTGGGGGGGGKGGVSQANGLGGGGGNGIMIIKIHA